MSNKSRYTEAGVDIDKANELVKKIGPVVASTFRKGVITEIGGFAGLFSLDTVDYRQPVLVSSTDGVGTKLKLAFMTGIHDTIGIDLVAMSVNDIVVTGALPLFFLDYFATGKLDSEVAEDVIRGIARGCQYAECSLIGGETAEMPGMYGENEYDLAGFAVGIADRDNIIDGSDIGVGHVVIGLASSGLHSNGYSLARKICFEELRLSVNDTPPEFGSQTVGQVLLEPTRIYVRPIAHLLKQFTLSGIVHITGGGFQDNIPRVLPDSCKAVIALNSWDMPPVFTFLREKGHIPQHEMLRTFNCGVGMVLVVPKKDAEEIMFQLEALGEKSFMLGTIEKRKEDEPPVEFL